MRETGRGPIREVTIARAGAEPRATRHGAARRGSAAALLELHRDREGDGARARQVAGRVDERVEGQRDAEDADQVAGLRQTAGRQCPRGGTRLDDGAGHVHSGEGARGALAAAVEGTQGGAVGVRRARHGETRVAAARDAGRTDGARAGDARGRAVAPASERVEGLAPAEAAEHGRLIGKVDRHLLDGAGVEQVRDRQRAEAGRRRRRTVVAGRIVPVRDGVSRRAAQAIVDAAVALVVGAADRAGLDEGDARAARAVGVGDAAEVGVRAALAPARLADPRATAAVRVRAAGRVGGVPEAVATTTRVIDTGAPGARRAGGDGAADAVAGAVCARVGGAAAPHLY